jgi:hypothetical protein
MQTGRVKYRPGRFLRSGAAGDDCGHDPPRKDCVATSSIALTARESHAKVRFEMKLGHCFCVSCRCCSHEVLVRLSLG